jgi:hypothetical protein
MGSMWICSPRNNSQGRAQQILFCVPFSGPFDGHTCAHERIGFILLTR